MKLLEFNEILSRLIHSGVQITMFMQGDVLWYNLNTSMKSYLHIRYDSETETGVYDARYDDQGLFNDWAALFLIARGCMQGGKYATGGWKAIFDGGYDDAQPNRIPMETIVGETSSHKYILDLPDGDERSIKVCFVDHQTLNNCTTHTLCVSVTDNQPKVQYGWSEMIFGPK